MKLFVTAIASGSNGNCYYVGNEEEAVLIDAGISCREIEQRMRRLELSIKKVKAVFISHEHTDHIRGVHVLSKKYKIPIYITPATLENAKLDVKNPYNIKLTSDVPVKIGGLEVLAFPKFHDARDPHSFIIRYQGICVGVFTDIGIPCENVIRNFQCCNAIFLETNYDEIMLQEGNYPYYLKRRISGDKGHLSNQQALELLLRYRPSFMTHVFLSHLSQDNNNPKLVLDLFKKNAQNSEIVVTSRTSEIALYEIKERS